VSDTASNSATTNKNTCRQLQFHTVLGQISVVNRNAGCVILKRI